MATGAGWEGGWAGWGARVGALLFSLACRGMWTCCLKVSWAQSARSAAAHRRLIEGPWWGRCLGRQPGAWWLEHIDAAALNAEPLRKRIGYLNTLEDLLKHLGHRMQASGGGGVPTADGGMLMILQLIA